MVLRKLRGSGRDSVVGATVFRDGGEHRGITGKLSKAADEVSCDQVIDDLSDINKVWVAK
jgi:hypothetical protein